MTGRYRQTPSPIPTRRLWLFRMLALLSPALLLVLVELGLRIGGAGYPSSFFLPAPDEGGTMLVENPKFGFRFFPPSVARSPLALRVARQKPPGTLRVVVLGESAAMGDPEPAYGLARQLERLLKARRPGLQVEVLNLAMTAINSHVFRQIARDSATVQADVWVVYAGNNEVVGPFGAGTVFGRPGAGVGVVRAQLWWKSTRLGQLLSRLARGSHEPQSWEGMELFLDQRIAAEDGRLRQTSMVYRENLEAVVKLARRSGAAVVLSTMPVNLKDCPPFASMHQAGLVADQLEAWNSHFKAGHAAEQVGDFAAALESYARAAEVDSDHAELAFRRATCHLRRGETGRAKALFELARDLDTLRFRADSGLNAVAGETAAKEGVPMVDAARALSARAPDGVVGEDCFYDHVHLNFSGNYEVARLLLPAVEKAAGLSGDGEGELLDADAMARELAFTAYDRHRVQEEMRLRLRQPPFTFQSNWATRDEHWMTVLRGGPGDLAQAVAIYEAAIRSSPQDWLLRANLARLQEVAGNATQAVAQWREVALQMPHLPDPWYQLGNLASGAGDLAEAANLYSRALRLRPDVTEALNGLALVCSAQGDGLRAVALLEEALRINPRFSAARVNLALHLAKQGNDTAATAQYERAIALDTNSVAARINFGKLLTRQGQWERAVKLYQEALAVAPQDPVAHYSLGNALASAGRYAEAVTHYTEAVRYSPDFPEAQFNLAMELVRGGRLEPAVPHFFEAVRLRPEWVDARFNYGVALAKLGRWEPAIEQFQEILKLEPGHAAARAALDRALQLSRR